MQESPRKRHLWEFDFCRRENQPSIGRRQPWIRRSNSALLSPNPPDGTIERTGCSDRIQRFRQRSTGFDGRMQWIWRPNPTLRPTISSKRPGFGRENQMTPQKESFSRTLLAYASGCRIQLQAPQTHTLAPQGVRCYLTLMKTAVSTKGQIVLPAEIRRLDRIEAGDEFEVERVDRGEYRLRLVPSRNEGLLDWLLACPEKGFFVPVESESTDTL